VRTLGIDGSLTSTGFAHPSANGVVTGRIKPSSKGVERLAAIRHGLSGVIGAAKPTRAFLEDYAMGARGKTYNIGEGGGVLRLTLYDFGIPFTVVSPTTLKLFSTGYGGPASSKDVMIATAIHHFGFQSSSNDEADALLLYWFGETLAGRPYPGWPNALVTDNTGKRSQRELREAQVKSLQGLKAQ